MGQTQKPVGSSLSMCHPKSLLWDAVTQMARPLMTIVILEGVRVKIRVGTCRMELGR